MKNVTCGEVREFLAAREMKLPAAPEAAHACELHLAACESCRRALLEGRELSELLAASLASYAEGADELAERIAEDLPAQRAAPVYWRSHAFRLDAVAAVLLFGAGLFVGWWFQPAPPPAGTPVVEQAPVAPAPVAPQLVGSSGTIAHELLPRDRVRTSERRRFIIVNSVNPDVILEVDREAEFEDRLKLPDEAGGEEVPVE